MANNTKEKTVKQEDIIYSINKENKTANIVGNEFMKPNLIIPRMIYYKRQEFIVKCIKERSFYFSKTIRTVRFARDSEVERIEKESFSLSSIKEIYLPSRLKYIDEEAFSICRKLQIVDIPQNSELQVICKDAFKSTMIETLTLPSSISELEEGWCHETSNLTNLIYIPNQNYLYLDGKYIISKSDKQKDEYDKLIFARRDLEEVTIPSIAKIIGSSSFNKTKIKNIFIPSQVTEIHEKAFSECKNLTEIYFEADSQLQNIGEEAFSYSFLKSISIPSKVTEISSNAFQGCQNLTEIYFEEDSQCQNIGEETFINTSIKSIRIPSHVKEICQGAFYGCWQLHQVEFAADSELQIIGAISFVLTSIQSISIPSSVKKICNEAFSGCLSLTTVIIPEDSKLQSIETEAFASTKIETLFLPATVSNLEYGWCKFTDHLKKVIVSEENKHFTNYGLNNEFVIGKSDENESEFDVLVFANRKQKIHTIPPFIKTIGSSSFEDAQIERITIPKHVTCIGEFAFGGCNKLRYVNVESNSELQIIDDKAFEESSIVSLQVPQHVTHISDDAFSQCNNLQIIEIDENSEFGKIDTKSFISWDGEYYLVMFPAKSLNYSNKI